MDRENRSLYILTVKVTPLAKRKAREVPVIKQFAEIERNLSTKLHFIIMRGIFFELTEILKLDSNEAAIVINVTDQNDEKPEFDQGSFGVVLTMNPSSEFGSIIGTVNVSN